MSDMPNSEAIAEVLQGLGVVESICRQMEWAEEEISKAQARHGEQGKGPIWRSFRLLTPTHDRMSSELLYRSHCHELLERSATGQDTRPATDAEILAALVETSLAVPLSSSAACLYFRLVNRSVPELTRAMEPAADLTAYEEVHGRQADEHESDFRRKLGDEARKLERRGQ